MDSNRKAERRFSWIYLFGIHLGISILVVIAVVFVSAACMDDGCPSTPDRWISDIVGGAVWITMLPVATLNHSMLNTDVEIPPAAYLILVPLNSAVYAWAILRIHSMLVRARK